MSGAVSRGFPQRGNAWRSRDVLRVAAGVFGLARWHVPRAIGAATIVVAVFALLYGAGAVIAPTVSDQLGVLKSRLPEAQARVERWLQQRGGLMRAVMGPGAPSDTG